MNYCIALQPICDASWLHVGDELLYRHDPSSQHAVIDCGLTATVRACNAAFHETGLDALVGERMLFFNTTRDWLLNPDLLPPRQRSAGDRSSGVGHRRPAADQTVGDTA